MTNTAALTAEENCPECNGSGEVERNIMRGEEGMQIEMDAMVECSECGGTGNAGRCLPDLTLEEMLSISNNKR